MVQYCFEMKQYFERKKMKNELPAGTYVVKLEVPPKSEKEVVSVFTVTIIDRASSGDDGRRFKLTVCSISEE